MRDDNAQQVTSLTPPEKSKEGDNSSSKEEDSGGFGYDRHSEQTKGYGYLEAEKSPDQGDASNKNKDETGN